MWFGGFKEGGLNRFNRTTGQFTQFDNNANDPNSLKYSYPTEFLENIKGNFWISTSDVSTATLSLFDRKLGKVIKRYEHNPSDANSLPKSLFNFTMINDKDDPNILWIGTYGSGLVKFEKKQQQFTKYINIPGDPTSLSANIVYELYEDKNGIIWVGTQTGGLCRFDKNKGTFTRYTYNPNDPNSIGKGFITEISEDSSGYLWVVSYGSGINKLDKKTGQFKHYSKENGFLTNQIQSGPLQDEQGKLWVSTDSGIIRFKPETGQIEKIYDKSDGLQGNAFQYFSSFKSNDGEMWFGGVNGVNSFKPEEITDNPFRPNVYLTSLTQGGEKITVNSALTALKEFKLDWQNNFFEFEFSGLNYSQPLKNQYKYMLEGLDKGWFDSGNRRFGRYSNLPGGDYTLKIKASNNDGLWGTQDQEVSINILVDSPFWKKWWFYLFAIALFITIIALIILYLIKLNSEINLRKKAKEALIKQQDVLEHQAHHDSLTSLPNRVLFNDRLSQSVVKAERHNEKFALLFIDLDRFKPINDSLGHKVGDKVLQMITNRLNTLIRNEDTLAFLRRLISELSLIRYKTILMEGLSKSQDASLLAQKILDTIAQPILIEQHVLYVSSSIGISLYPEDDLDANNLLKYADAAMFKAKQKGAITFNIIQLK